MNVIGRKPVLELLQSPRSVKRVVIVLGTQGRIIGDIISAAKAKGVRIDRIPPEKAKGVVGTGNHQGVMAEVSPMPLHKVTDLGGAIPVEHGLILVLDGITDPHHLGACARSALAAGCDALLVPERRGATPNDTAIKVSAGTLLRLPVIVEKNLPRALEELKQDDWWIHGTAGGESESLWDHAWDGKTVLVIGSEGEGMSRLVAEMCDHRVTIPMSGEVESLSASAAASVVLFDIARKRAAGQDSTPA